MRDLSIRQLKLFLKLAESGSFTETAHAQGVSQPALSRAIKEMEGAIGAQLFDRSGRGVSLTAVGHQLLPIANHLVAEFDSGFSSLAEQIKAKLNRLTIATIGPLLSAVVAPAIGVLRQSHANIDLVILSGFANDVDEAVYSGKAEVGFAPKPAAESSLAFTRISCDELVLVSPISDGFDHRESATWGDLNNRNLIVLGGRSTIQSEIYAAMESADIRIRAKVECSGYADMGPLLLQRLGMAVVPRSALTLLGTGLVAVPIVPTVIRQLGIVRRSDRPLSSLASQLIDLVTVN